MKKFRIILLVAVIAITAAVLWKGYSPRQDGGKPAANGETTVTLQENGDYGSPYKFYYDELTDIEKRAYDAIISEIYAMPESITLPRIDTDQLDAVFTALLYDNPDLFFLGRNATLRTQFWRVSCSIDYIIGKEEYAEYKAQLDEVCNEVISGLTDIEDEWQTELEIHDYIVKNCEYTRSNGNYICSSSYGALVNGKAACEGYSKAAKLLFDMVGIESAVVSGVSTGSDGNSGAHMWNAVKILGDFYYLDCTWDDPVSKDGENVNVYSYFNINTEMISETHSEFFMDFGCTATAANYFVKTGRYFESYDRSGEEKLASAIAQALESGVKKIGVRFATREAYNDAKYDLIDNGRIYDVLSLAREKTDIGFSKNTIDYYADDGLLELSFVPEIY